MIWVASVGSVVASNTWREWLLATGFLLFGVSLGRKRWPGWSSVFVFLALLLGVYQALALILARDRLASTLEGPGEFYSDRPMSASLALIMVLGFVLLLSRPRPRTNVGDLVGAGFLGISAVLSQHRSVWVSLFIAVILLAWGNVRRGRVGRGWLLALMSPIGYAGLALVLSSTVAISLFPGGNVTAVGSVGVPESAASTATVAWRWEMWESRLTASRSLMEWLFGCVFGVSPVKWPGTEVMNGFISGHNAMVDTITMYGLVGLVVVCTMLWQAVGSPRMLLSPAGIFVCASLGFSVFYTLPSWSWLVIGVALAYASTGRSSPDGGRVADRESLLVGDP